MSLWWYLNHCVLDKYAFPVFFMLSSSGCLISLLKFCLSELFLCWGIDGEFPAASWSLPRQSSLCEPKIHPILVVFPHLKVLQQDVEEAFVDDMEQEIAVPKISSPARPPPRAVLPSTQMVEKLVHVPVPSFHECSLAQAEQKEVLLDTWVRDADGCMWFQVAGPREVYRWKSGTLHTQLDHSVEVPQIQFLTGQIEAGGFKWKMEKEKRERVVTIASCCTDGSTDYTRGSDLVKTWLLQVAEISGTMTSAVFFLFTIFASVRGMVRKTTLNVAPLLSAET